MDFIEECLLENIEIAQRYELARERIIDISNDTMTSAGFGDYFRSLAGVFVNIFEFYDKAFKDNKVSSEFNDDPELFRKYNEIFYCDIKGENYDKSYTNSDHIYYLLKSGKLSLNGLDINSEEELKNASFYYAWLASEVRSAIFYAYENRLYFITIVAELFIQIYLSSETFDMEELKDIAYWYAFDYADVFVRDRIVSSVIPEASLGSRLISGHKFENEDELYLYGEYIGDNELGIFRHLKSLSDDDIELMAETFVNAYIEGFVKANKPIDKKSTVNIRYPIGFERMVVRAVELFEEKGLRVIAYRRAVSVHSRTGMRIGYSGGYANPQFDYDHRNDYALIYDKKYAQRRIEVTGDVYKELEDYGKVHAGPAVLECFGEKPFAPAEKKCSIRLDDSKAKLYSEMQVTLSELASRFIPADERSFTIMSFPVPEIGNDFAEIFNETLKINTLDTNLYQDVQQKLIDALDKGDHVHIEGMNGNLTNLDVKLHVLRDPEKETDFENCLADVNIPLGEVFTSPALKGTNGMLHTKKVYLNGLLYKNLKFELRDGMTTGYDCDDGSEDKGRKYIKDTVLYHHESLPLGEFAIGTNTYAYSMARKYDIDDRMTILIAEKTGPHFALGDTCYSHEEEVPVFNPDGKEVIARHNELTLIEPDETGKAPAYFGCHTDITIPYDELAKVSVVKSDGSEIMLIENGRFVLEGTQVLNEALFF